MSGEPDQEPTERSDDARGELPPTEGDARAAESEGTAAGDGAGGTPDAAATAPEGEGAAASPPADGAPGEGDAGPERAAASPGQGGEGTAPRRKRRRRRKRGGQGANAAAAGPGGGAEQGSAEDGGEEEGNTADAGAEGAAPDGPGSAREGADAPGGKKGKRRRERKRAPGTPPWILPSGAIRERAAFSTGEEVFGKVASVTEEALFIDLAGKAMGIFDRCELEGEPPEEGAQFIAHVVHEGMPGGYVVLTRSLYRGEVARTKVEEASRTGEVVLGLVTGAIRGGLEVDVEGLRAFAPASHVDLRPGSDLAHLVGHRFPFVVSRYEKEGRDVILSRRAMLEEEARRARSEALARLEPGTVVKGVVRSVLSWGVFVSLPEANGIEGLLHMTEASHDRGAQMADLFKVGDELEVKVLKVDEKGKVSLSRKALTPDPWQEARAKYAQGTRHKGKVARLQPFGAFIELEPGIDGLCQTGDLSLKPIEHPSEVVKVGDELDVVVAHVDASARRIALHPAPPPGEEDEPRQKIAPHKVVRVAVVSAGDPGLVVRILGVTGRAARGFIPAGQTGTHRGTDLRKEFPAGTRLEAKIIDVDPRRGEPKLSIKALREDAEKQAYQQYRSHVAREAKFGTFADLMKPKG